MERAGRASPDRSASAMVAALGRVIKTMSNLVKRARILNPIESDRATPAIEAKPNASNQQEHEPVRFRSESGDASVPDKEFRAAACRLTCVNAPIAICAIIITS